MRHFALLECLGFVKTRLLNKWRLGTGWLAGILPPSPHFATKTELGLDDTLLYGQSHFPRRVIELTSMFRKFYR